MMKTMTPELQTRFYSTREAAALFEVSVETIRRMVSDGRLTALRLGRGFRFEERVLKAAYLECGGEEQDWLLRIRPQLRLLDGEAQLKLPGS
jgi:excisionase family DNA binding protein